MRFTTLVFLVACTGGKGGDADTGGDSDTDTDADSDTDSDADSDTDPTGQCGEVTEWDLVIFGAVNALGGQPAEAAHVVLKDRVWDPGTILGETASNAQGLFELNVHGVTSLELCWGTLGYYIEADDHATQFGDAGVNTALYNEIVEAQGLGVVPPGVPDFDSGMLTVDLTAVPIQMAESR